MADDAQGINSELAMQQACKLGDLPKLKNIISISSNEPTSAINIHALLTTAVQHQHPQIITFLLTTHPTISLSQSTEIVISLLSTANIPILRLLLTHDPSFASTSLDYGMRTFLTDACFQPPEKINELLHVLLDAGADVNDGMGPGGGALLAALLGGQGRDVVGKIVKRGAFVGESALAVAVEKERMDILGMLLRSGEKSFNLERTLQRAQEGGSKKVIEILEEFEGKEEVIDRDKSKKAGEKRRWWKFVGR